MNNKKSLKEVYKRFIEFNKKNNNIKKPSINLKLDYEATSTNVEKFIFNNIMDLQEEGSYCLDICEEENNFHMVSYWINGTYAEVERFICENYNVHMEAILLSKYPNNIENLKKQILKLYGYIDSYLLCKEILATLLLKEMQYYVEWYSVFGTEEEDMIELRKYEINSALYNSSDFPIVKSEDITAAILGVNNMMQPSDLYDVFAHYSDELAIKKEQNLLDTFEDYIFTPDPFLVTGVEARWKNMFDLIEGLKGKCCIDYIFEFNSLNEIKNKDIRNKLILESILNDYFNRFSKPPVSLPIERNMIIGVYKDNKYDMEFRIRGIKNKKTDWDTICIKNYEIPKSVDDYQNIIYKISIDFKRELNGLKKGDYKSEESYPGKYPNRFSASHGLTFVKDINVKIKNKRGITERKKPIARYSLNLAEKQSTYFIKKSLRYALKNPILSTSFGIDSIITQHLLKKVAKHSYNLVHNDSLVEYNELVQFRNRIIKEWDVENRIIITKPIETYWQLLDKNGFNFKRKGDRRGGPSPSEQCCNAIKHKPMGICIENMIKKGNPMEVNYTGLRAFESRAREQQVKRDGIVYYAKSWKSLRVNPIAFFTDVMVWEYVSKYKVPYCSVYDKVLYYEDVFDNVSEDEYGKVIYRPRIGCWPCAVTGKNYYFHWLRHFYRKQYEFLMINRGMAKEIYIEGAKKQGIISDFTIDRKNSNNNIDQISLFDNPNIENDDITSEDILNKYPLEYMEEAIMRRPCIFMV